MEAIFLEYEEAQTVTRMKNVSSVYILTTVCESIAYWLYAETFE